jgi:hypothetical protein
MNSSKYPVTQRIQNNKRRIPPIIVLRTKRDQISKQIQTIVVNFSTVEELCHHFVIQVAACLVCSAPLLNFSSNSHSSANSPATFDTLLDTSSIFFAAAFQTFSASFHIFLAVFFAVFEAFTAASSIFFEVFFSFMVW